MPIAFPSGTSYGSAVPFQRVVEPSQLGSFLNLEQAELLRIQRYGEAQRFYLGKQWNFRREDGEPLVTINYYRKLIDKSAEFLLGAGFSINVADALKRVTLPLLKEVWGYNRANQLSWEVALMGGITGDVFVLVTYEEPTEMQRRINPYSQGKIRIQLLGSEQVFPTWDPLNVNVLTAVRVETIFFADRGNAYVDRDDRRNHQGRQLHTKRFSQIITPDQIIEQFQGEQPIVRRNILGEIPLVHIVNTPVPREYYGLGDGQDLTDLQREFNEKATDISDVIHYQGQPVTVIFGARAKALERGPRQIWAGLPENARVEQLNLQTDLGAANNYLSMVKKALHELSDVPEGALGAMQPISNTSGTALAMQYQPLQAKTKKKRAYYEAGFEGINYFVLRIAQATGLLALPYDLCSECGGRIVEVPTGKKARVWVANSQDTTAGTFELRDVKQKRCFHIDPETLEFVEPEELRLKFVKEYGFGTEIREAPLSMIAREIKLKKPSFWDYTVLVEEEEAKLLEKAGVQQQPPQQATPEGQAGSPPVPPPPPAPAIPNNKRSAIRKTKLPAKFVTIPEEPEEVTWEEVLLHPVTGAEVVRETVTRMLVPTGCKRPTYLNPFETKVTFHDVLPKDEALQAQLYTVYQQAGWVDPTWARERIPEIAEDRAEIERRMESAAQAAPSSDSGGYQELAPTSETGEGGDTTPVEGQAEKQAAGKAKAAEERENKE